MKGKKEYVGLLLINVFIIVSVSLAASVDNVRVEDGERTSRADSSTGNTRLCHHVPACVFEIVNNNTSWKKKKTNVAAVLLQLYSDMYVIY